ncbi:MAG: hypothetical protein QOJ01_1571, partial [Solirubrobacterales bacterium]|nr:hypothetical protein [Solirubrobacterales bacterium]
GFELYVEMLDQAVAELRSAGGEERTDEEVRVDSDISAYVPSSYVPYEAAKIDVHRRIAGARAPGELRALADELRDRFGPMPEPVSSLLELGRLRIELAKAGAAVAEVRGGRFSATPIELDANAVGAIRKRIPEAIYETRTKTLALRVEDDPATRLAQVVELTEALGVSSP